MSQRWVTCPPVWEGSWSGKQMDHNGWGNIQLTNADKIETDFWAKRSPVHFTANGPIVG